MTLARAVQFYQVVRQGSWLVMMLALARASVSLPEVGNLEALRYLGLIVTGPLVAAGSTAYLRVRQSTEHPERWFVLMTLATLLAGLAVIAYLNYGGVAAARALLDFGTLDFALPFGIYLLGALIAALVTYEAVADGAYRRLLWMTVVSYTWQVAAFVVPLYLGLPMVAVVWLLASTVIPRLGFLLWRYGRTRDALLPVAPERRLFASQFSNLMAYSIFGIVVTAIDYYLVGHEAADAESAVGLWRYGAQEIPFVLGIVGGLSTTALAEGRGGVAAMAAALRRRARVATHGLLALAAGLMVASPYIFGYVLGEEFYPAHVVFNTMLLVLPSRLVITQPLLVSEDMQRSMLGVGFGESLLNVGVSLALLPSLGLLGIAVGTVVAFTAERVAYVVLLARRGHAVSSYSRWRELLLFSAVLVGLYWLSTDFAALRTLN